MTDLIRVKNVAYSRYEELLLQRENLKKEAYHQQQEYIRVFGPQILELFRLKLECVRKKKTIEYCQRALNFGKSVDQEALQVYLAKELASFQEQLDQMVFEQEEANKATTITELELLKIKKIYHRLIKQMHPDINPLVEQSEALQDLWNRIRIAYACNDLKALEELEVLALQALKETGHGSLEVEIPNIDEKILELEQEILEIRSRDPYQYIYLLSDPSAVEEKKKSLNEEIKSYQDYADQLETILKELMGEGVTVTWRMN